MERKGGIINDTLAGYPDATKRVAEKEHAVLLVNDLKPFDPSHPGAAADFHYAVSPVKDLAKLEGN